MVRRSHQTLLQAGIHQVPSSISRIPHWRRRRRIWPRAPAPPHPDRLPHNKSWKNPPEKAQAPRPPSFPLRRRRREEKIAARNSETRDGEEIARIAENVGFQKPERVETGEGMKEDCLVQMRGRFLMKNNNKNKIKDFQKRKGNKKY